jgi:hypothetical protein
VFANSCTTYRDEFGCGEVRDAADRTGRALVKRPGAAAKSRSYPDMLAMVNLQCRGNLHMNVHE